jgi:REP element-mobilizing transposase RayT
MSIRNVPLVSGEFFHIYNRGNSKQEIFLEEEDYSRFVKLLYLCNSEHNVRFRDDVVKKCIDAFDFKRGESIVSIGAWVLMPNHFHLYITSPRPGLGLVDDQKDNLVNITKFIQKVCTSYSMYFNKKYDRTGSLFEGRFKSVHVKNDNQAKYLFSYIHLNPVKLIQKDWKDVGIKDKKKSLEYLSTYKWSSYLDHKGIQRKESAIINLEDFPQYFSDTGDFDQEILTWLSYKDN